MDKQLHWIDFLPLAFFAWGTRLVGLTTTGDSWAHAFYLGAILTLLQMTYYWYRGLRMDYIALGANLFLIYGALGYAIHKSLLIPYDVFKQSIIFVWVLLVGFVATLALPDGFIQLPDEKNKHNLIGSLALLGLTSIALILSFCLVKFFGVGTAFGVVLPFVGLLSARKILRNYLIKQA